MSIVEAVEDAGSGSLLVQVVYGSARQPLTARLELRRDQTITCTCRDYLTHHGTLMCSHCYFVLFHCCKVPFRPVRLLSYHHCCTHVPR